MSLSGCMNPPFPDRVGARSVLTDLLGPAADPFEVLLLLWLSSSLHLMDIHPRCAGHPGANELELHEDVGDLEHHSYHVSTDGTCLVEVVQLSSTK